MRQSRSVRAKPYLMGLSPAISLLSCIQVTRYRNKKQNKCSHTQHDTNNYTWSTVPKALDKSLKDLTFSEG